MDASDRLDLSDAAPGARYPFWRLACSMCYSSVGNPPWRFRVEKIRWHLTLGVLLVALSAAIYAFQISIFHRPDETWFYMLQDFAFVPIQVLLVTLIINEMMSVREKAALRKKMNMVIGVFFSEVGAHLLRRITLFDGHSEAIISTLKVNAKWSDQDFARGRKAIRDHEYAIDCRRGDLEDLQSYIVEKTHFLLGLLENPNLLEHQTFTDLLWAVFHLAEELAMRPDVRSLPEADYAHLAVDIKRAYSAVLLEWVSYVQHLKDEYPYLFSIVVRTNPFSSDASAVIE
jgi:hypothetical protein